MIRVRLVAALAALPLALVACSDDDPDPKVDPTPSPSPSPSATSSTPSPTTDPPESMTAVQAVRSWVRERNQALNSGDTLVLRELTADGCSSCEPYIDLIEDIYEAGGRYETEGWTVDKAKELKPMVVTAAITMGGGFKIAAAGEAGHEYEEDKALFRFKVRPQGDALVVTFVGLIQ